MNEYLRPFALIALLLALLTGGCGQRAERGAAARRARSMGGPFTLTDEDGRRVSDRDFAGKYRLVYFGFTFCPDVCPTDMAMLGAGAAPLRGERSGPGGTGPADLHQRRSGARHARGAAPLHRRLPSALDRPHRQRGRDRPGRARATASIYERGSRGRRRRLQRQSPAPGDRALRPRRRADRDPAAARPRPSGRRGRRRRSRTLGAMRERFWELPLGRARPRGMGGACATAAANAACTSSRTRSDRPALSDQRRLPPARPDQLPLHRLQASPRLSCPIACGSTRRASTRSAGCPRPAPTGCAPTASRSSPGII